MEKNIHLQMWNIFVIYCGKVFAIWLTLGNVYIFALVEAKAQVL